MKHCPVKPPVPSPPVLFEPPYAVDAPPLEFVSPPLPLPPTAPDCPPVADAEVAPPVVTLPSVPIPPVVTVPPEQVPQSDDVLPPAPPVGIATVPPADTTVDVAPPVAIELPVEALVPPAVETDVTAPPASDPPFSAVLLADAEVPPLVPRLLRKPSRSGVHAPTASVTIQTNQERTVDLSLINMSYFHVTAEGRSSRVR